MAGTAALGQQPPSAPTSVPASLSTPANTLTGITAASSHEQQARQEYLRQLQNEDPEDVARATLDEVLRVAKAAASQALCRCLGLSHHTQQTSAMMVDVTQYLGSQRPLEGTLVRFLGAGAEGVTIQVTFQEPAAVMGCTACSEAAQNVAAEPSMRPDVARKFVCYTAIDVLVQGHRSLAEVGLGTLNALDLLPDLDQGQFGVVCADNITIWPTRDCKQEMLRSMGDFADLGAHILEEDLERLDGVPGVMIVLDFKLYGRDLYKHVLEVEHALEHPGMLGEDVSPQLQRSLMDTPLGTHVVNVLQLWRLSCNTSSSLDMLVHDVGYLHGDQKPCNFLTLPGSEPDSKHGDSCDGVHLGDLGTIRIQAQPADSQYLYSEGAIMGTLGLMGSGRERARASGDMRLRQEYEVEAYTGTAIFILLGCSYEQASALMNTPGLWLKIMPDQALAQQLLANNPELVELAAASKADADLWWDLLQQIGQQGVAGQAFMAMLGVIAQANLLSRWSLNNDPPLFNTMQLMNLFLGLHTSHMRELMSLDAPQHYVVMPHSNNGVLRVPRDVVLRLLDQAVRQPRLLKGLCRYHPDTIEWLQQEVSGPVWQSLLKPKLVAKLQRKLQVWQEQQPAPKLLSYQQKELEAGEYAAAYSQATAQMLQGEQNQQHAKTQRSEVAAGMLDAAADLVMGVAVGRPDLKVPGRRFNSLEAVGSTLHAPPSAWKTVPHQDTATRARATGSPATLHFNPAATRSSSSPGLQGGITSGSTPDNGIPALMPAVQHQSIQATTQNVAGGETLPTVSFTSSQARTWTGACSPQFCYEPSVQQRTFMSGYVPLAGTTSTRMLPWKCLNSPIPGGVADALIGVSLPATPQTQVACDVDVEQASTHSSRDSDLSGTSSTLTTSSDEPMIESPEGSLGAHVSLLDSCVVESGSVEPAMMPPTAPAKKKKGPISKLLRFAKLGSKSSTATSEQVQPAETLATGQQKKAGLLSKTHANSNSSTAYQQPPSCNSLQDCSPAQLKGRLSRLFKHDSKASAKEPNPVPLLEDDTEPAESRIYTKLKYEAQRAGLGLESMFTEVRHFIGQAPAELKQEAQRAGQGLKEMRAQLGHFFSQVPGELRNEAERVGSGLTDMLSQVRHFVSHVPGEMKSIIVCGAPSHS